MAIQILQDISLNGGIQFTDSKADFPPNPGVGTMVLKGTCLYAYITIGGMETWYPFANRTNSYVHTQGAANTVWTITHNLHTTDVWVQIKDSDEKIVNATVTVLDPDTVRINFTTAITGSAVIVAPDSIDVPEVKASVITVGPNVLIDSTGVRINGSYALTAASIDQQIADAIAIETTARQSADATLTSNLAAETSARIAGDATLQASISTNFNFEVTARQAADATLQANINTETSARIAADATLQGNIDAEASARQAADALKADLVAGKVPASQLPSYVDDVLEYANLAAFPVTGETGKIYVALDTNKTYRWSGSAYIFITSGAVDSVNGKTGSVTLTKSDIGLGSVDDLSSTYLLDRTNHTGSQAISTVTGLQTALDSKLNSSSYTAADVLAKIKTVDGSGSGLDADTLDGLDSTAFATAGHTHAGTYQPLDADLTAIAGLTGTSGVLKKTAADTWALDTSIAPVSVVDDTATSATRYVTFGSSTSGTISTLNVSSTKLTFNPSNGQLNATTFNSTSDARKKTDVVSIVNAVDTVGKLNGVEFSWIENGQKSAGVIAQELEAILPHLVSTDAEGSKSVNYSGIIGYLINAVKELDTKVKQLEAK